MAEKDTNSLKVVDGLELDELYTNVLKPEGLLKDLNGRLRKLPRFFYEVKDLSSARETQLAPNFGVYEFIHTDFRESPALWGFPKYLPCAISILAAHLSLIRKFFDACVYIAANGGYRSPSHRLSRYATAHHWGTAANIYRIGDDYLDTEEKITRYNYQIKEILPGCWLRPFGHEIGFADDHIHLEIGYMNVVPRDMPGEVAED